METDLLPLLLKQWELYPHLQFQDLVKLIYQNEFGPGHLVRSEADSLKRLQTECASLEGRDAKKFEDIGNGLCRLHLAEDIDIDLTTLNHMFVHTANTVIGTGQRFQEKLKVLLDCCHKKLLPFTETEAEEWLGKYREQGFPLVSHSAAYRAAYSPAYRVVLALFRDYYLLFSTIDKLRKFPEPVLIAIDGNSCAGKTSLAALVEKIYDCNVFHMDDFFLPMDQRTEGRLRQPGGNIEFERFFAEVMTKLRRNKPFSYRPFRCAGQALGEPVNIRPKQLNIIEGAYSLHPSLAGNYHLKVFMGIGPEEQSRRVLARNGQTMHRRFMEEWIPRENRYLKEFKIREQCDLVFA